jgi:hypothetical protein
MKILKLSFFYFLLRELSRVSNTIYIFFLSLKYYSLSYSEFPFAHESVSRLLLLQPVSLFQLKHLTFT